MKSSAFDLFHPVVALVYFAVLLVLGMAAIQPVYMGITFLGALVCGLLLRGWRATGRALVWQLPLVAIIAVANFLLSASGLTELFCIGGHVFYMEALVYGACMGLMLASVLQIFANVSCVLTSDKVMALFGGVAPTVGLVLSMAARLVPQFVRRGKDIGNVAHACTAASWQANAAQDASAKMDAGTSAPASSARRLRLRENLRLVTVLMSWGMEDSLETADAMKARGWGAHAQRTTYARFRFRCLDAVVLVVLGALAIASIAAAWTACAQFGFYPALHGWAFWPSYAPYALFVSFPLFIEARERAVWKV